MARPDDLVPGNCYFSLTYYDDDLRLPLIETRIYVGRRDDGKGEPVWLFKEPDPLPDPDDPEATMEPNPLHAFTDRQLHEILDFAELITELNAVSLLHPLTAPPHLEHNPAGDTELTGLDQKIIRFLDDDDCAALTITIRHTDDGLSLGRDEHGFHVRFFMRPGMDPAEDTAIQALFAGLNAVAVKDYFADDGRTHMLEYPCPREPNEIVQLCRRILIEVYAMRRGDVLDFAPVRRRTRST